MEKRIVYMDHAASTYLKPEVLEEMKPLFLDKFGNPSGLHYFAREARKQVDMARERIANAINAEPDEIYFTSGGTESNNWALRGIAAANPDKMHIITSSIEHHATLNTCQAMEKQGYEITYLKVDKYGFIDLYDVEKAIKPDTLLISIMLANNEIGTLEPIAEIAKLCRESGVIIHTDAIQAFGSIPIDVKQMKVDLMSLSGHKFYGPKGIGILYVRKGVKIAPFIYGGGQEREKRAGTENTVNIVGIGKAAEVAVNSLEKEAVRIRVLRDRLIDGLLKIHDTVLNGHPDHRLPNNVNISFKGVEAESLLMMLDMQGIAASGGSACSTGSLEPSHVLEAIGLDSETAKGTVRFSLGYRNTEEDVDYVLEKLPPIIEKLRSRHLFLQTSVETFI